MSAPQHTGAGPPANVAPADLWAKLTTLPRPHTEVAFPRKHPVTGEWFTDKVALRVLTESELMKARAAADAYARDLLGSKTKQSDANAAHNADIIGGSAYEEIRRNACVVEVLWLACRSATRLPDSLGIPAFPSTMMMRQYFTSDEFAVLFQAYAAFQSESGPILSSMTPDEMEAWIAVLQEGASRVPLSRLPLAIVQDLLMHTVSLLPRPPTANGFAGSPPSDSSQNTDQAMSPQTLASLRTKRANTSQSLVVSADERPEPVERDE
jgi:hypothetical protein